ncbi:glycoside hydrolase family 2 TIM barrel-domain containing protein [Tichowtungia aerotolerans]|uniref:DUF4982 domain-containing protein n=1 Tax=Tichowtungia aerotolerans TaxID=2697043 RepID=A0A6P1M6A8_9BACT|nr:glycoside hydrolase family 2 TIM barrel-domain containing protein [Tichowtungia aerotolerans]QHI70339.1 DUF4982 domain-containing protein [Tichowtungia aerotolerans]
MNIKQNVLLGLALLSLNAAAEREVMNFNEAWRFQKADVEASSPELDDSQWRTLNLPHDWGIEGPFDPELPNRTGKLPWAGIGWYRKHFQCSGNDLLKKVFIDFDGAMSDSTVWLNGKLVGGWPYGYSSFRLELTPYLKKGDNVLAVKLDNKEESSRWYPGGGIYRNVRLVKTDAVHVDHWGISVTKPNVSETSATVVVTTDVVGADDHTQVFHEIVGAGISGSGTDCSLTVSSPKLWSLEAPNLYTLKTVIKQDGNVVDTVETVFGIRSIEYTKDGFFLNGQQVRMKGVCQHHDLGPLGTTVNKRALERQIEILQEMGCNAIRTSHNPPAPELLELCDRMGMLVQVEAFDCWKASKTPNDYGRFFPEWHEKDLRAMIHRDRNHPCVVMWSTGNEVKEMRNKEGILVSQMLADIVHKLDPTRPVTTGCNHAVAGFNGFEKTVDVFGFNYKAKDNAAVYRRFMKEHPDQPFYGSETASCISSRGEYFFPVLDDKAMGQGGHFQVSSYDLFAPPWAYKPDVEFEALDRYPAIFGEFVWTGFDYIGEPTPYNKDNTNLLNFTDPDERKHMEEQLAKLGGNIPPRSSYFGIVDLCGFKKDRFYIYQARWRPELPMAHILPHWNWPERVGEVTPVHVYTSGDEVELFLNGKSLGRKKKGEYEYRLRWDDVVYESGELKAVAYKNGKPWAEDVVKTTGTAAKLELTADRAQISADGTDLSFVTLQVSDGEGLLVPRTHNRFKLSIDGPGEIIAVGNGDPTNLESFQSLDRNVFNGLALVVVRSKKSEPGTIRLTAQCDGLQDATIQIQAK